MLGYDATGIGVGRDEFGVGLTDIQNANQRLTRPHVNRLPLKGILTDCKKVTREDPARLTLLNSATRRQVPFRGCRHLDDPYVGSAERFELLLGRALVRNQRRYPFDTCHDH